MVYVYAFLIHQRKKIPNIKENKSVKSLEGVLQLSQLLLIKSDHRLSRNYLKGFIGDKINLLLVLTAFNLKKWINNYLRLLFLYRFLLLGVILYKIEDKED